MKWLPTLRLLVFARRITIALESIALSLSTLAHISSDTWKEQHPVPTRGSRSVSIESFDQREANKRWRESQAPAGIDDLDDLDASGNGL